MTLVVATLLTLASGVVEGPEPEDVKAGWLGLGVFLALAAAVVVLALSLRKHLGRVDFEEEPDGSDEDEPGREDRPGDEENPGTD